MTGNSVIADTNIFIEVMKGNKGLADALDRFSAVYLSPFVRSELYFGAYKAANSTKHLEKVRAIVRETLPLAVDADTADIFVQTKLKLLAIGRPIPENDSWIAASALQHGLPVLTNDAHFSTVESLTLIH